MLGLLIGVAIRQAAGDRLPPPPGHPSSLLVETGDRLLAEGGGFLLAE